MAIYRTIPINIWEDTKMSDDFTPEDRLFWIYLITNSKSNICGCYEVNLNKMSNEIGYTKIAIQNLLERFENVHKVIKYDAETREILMLNWYKYNWNNSINALKSIEKSISGVKSDYFQNILTRMFNNFKEGKPLARGLQATVAAAAADTVSVTDTDTVIEGVVGGEEKQNKKFIPPTIDEVEDYIKQRGSSVNAQVFYDYFTVGKWKDGKGDHVKNWKQKLITWESHQPKGRATPKGKKKLKNENTYNEDEVKKALFGG